MLDCYKDYIEEKGVSLRDIGLQEKAFTRNDAMEAISLLSKGVNPILGGDVYFRCGQKNELAYANWYSSKKVNEKSEDFFARSLAEAAKYIESFPHRADREPLFSLVLGEG
jgi:hypothetical protein